jgi:hypothetical protein
VEAQENLKEQIAKEKQGRDATLDEMEKVNRKLEIQINLMTVYLRNSLDQTRRMAASANRGVTSTFPTVMKGARAGIKTEGAVLKRMSDWLGLEKGSKAADIMESDWQAYKEKTGGNNTIGLADANLAINAANRTGPAGDKDLLAVLSHGMSGRNFSSGGIVHGRELDRVATTIANQATNEQLGAAGGDRLQLKNQLVREFKEALENSHQQITIKFDDETKRYMSDASAVAKDAGNAGRGHK